MTLQEAFAIWNYEDDHPQWQEADEMVMQYLFGKEEDD